jgi:cysteine synthase A
MNLFFINSVRRETDSMASMMNSGILSTIGNTPLVKLERVFKDASFRLFAKLEMSNPGGSIKDRTAFNMLKSAMEEGDVGPGTTIIESSSGNLGIGLAQACRFLGLHFICVVDPKTTEQNIAILKAYGAEISMVKDPDPKTGEFLPARIERVHELLESIPNSYWTNQYANLNNSGAHYQTMKEIVTALDGKLDYFFCAVSTCGTLRGCSEYIRNNNLGTKIISIDALGSIIYDKTTKCKRLIPGHGAARMPELFIPGLEDEYVHVTDLDCVTGCRQLLRREAILAGGSSGGVISAIKRKAHEIPAGATCVAIFPDSGERYMDTVYSDEWVAEHFGDVFHLWENE